MQASRKTIKTPCVGICSTVVGDVVCRGCKRFSHEIIHWNSYNAQQKLIVIRRLNRFLSQVVQGKFVIVDLSLFYRNLPAQQQSLDIEPYLYLYNELCGGRLSDNTMRVIGVELSAPYRETAMNVLRDMIDEEFLVLSQAHFDRYIRLPNVSVE